MPHYLGHYLGTLCVYVQGRQAGTLCVYVQGHQVGTLCVYVQDRRCGGLPVVHSDDTIFRFYFTLAKHEQLKRIHHCHLLTRHSSGTNLQQKNDARTEHHHHSMTDYDNITSLTARNLMIC